MPKSVQIIRPSRATPLVLGGALGAALMYWLDPQSGRRRRAIARDRSRHAVHATEELLDRARRDAEQRGRGVVARTRGAISSASREATDEVLAERVRAALGHVCSHPGAVQVLANDGRVELSGHVLAAEHVDVVRRVREVRGVRSVEDALVESPDEAREPSLQGGRRRGVARAGSGPRSRLAYATAGASLLYLGARARGTIGWIAGALGAGLLARGVARRRPSLGPGDRRMIEIRKGIEIAAPIERVYAFFSAIEEFPRFMRHVLAVRPLGGDRHRWTVRGPAGTQLTWDAFVTAREPNRLLAWESAPGSRVVTSGRVHFSEISRGLTRVDLQMSYAPPLGVLGDAVASIFGADAKTELDEDMLRFQSLLEDGRARGHDVQVSAEEIEREMGQRPRV